MPIGIDHVAICSTKFEDHIKIIKSLGYQLVFTEKNVENLQIKHDLMKRFSDKHNLTLLTAKNNIGIEFINHKYVNSNDGYIIPIFENVPSELTEKIKGKKIQELVFNTKMKLDSIPNYILDDVGDTFQFSKILVKTKNVSKSTKFWEYLGFRVLRAKKDFSLLEFRSLFNKEVYHMYLILDKNINDMHYLDDNGFNCIAFISNSAENEKKVLDKKGINTTKIEKLTLNQKLLNIFFARGFCGELVEIISIEKK